MKYWTDYNYHDFDVGGKRKLYDKSIYTFDIETSSYIILDDKVYPALIYDKLSEEEKSRCIKQSNMYIWQFGINDTIYYGRTYEELDEFLENLYDNSPNLKYVYVHNLSFEFQHIKSHFHLSEVFARAIRKPMKCFLNKYNIIFRCSYFLTNAALAQLPKLYNLDIKKMVGDLDYNKVRNSLTELTDEELRYCEYDCLVLYEAIKKEISEYGDIKKIPLTSTGKVRREFKELVDKDYNYKSTVRRMINTNPYVYNLMIEAFAGGYTHENVLYTDEIMYNLESVDETSAYPYVMVAFEFPATQFQNVKVTSIDRLLPGFAYILKLRITKIEAKTFNTFLSASKCRNIVNGIYDNGRILRADYLEVTLTDVDLEYLKLGYNISDDNVEIEEAWNSLYRRLPRQYVDFILNKYINKTNYKDREGYELEYAKEKNKFNALYGMTVTNTIRSEVEYNGDWREIPLTNEEIEEKLQKEYTNGFLSFSTGVWVTAWARYNLIMNCIKLDEYVVYMDTDSMKLREGYDKQILTEYNNSVLDKLKAAAEYYEFDIERFMPEDIHGVKHPLGIFELDAEYSEFISQGAKKYCYRDKKDNELHITVAGVPKKARTALTDISEFRDNFVFKFEDTNKHIIAYNDEQIKIELTDYQGNTELVEQTSGACLLPTTYVLGKALEYANLISDTSSRRARWKG